MPVNASVAIRIETVKPIPAIAPPASTEPHPTGGLIRPPLSLVTSHVAPLIPTGLPTTYPTMIPSVIGEPYAVVMK